MRGEMRREERGEDGGGPALEGKKGALMKRERESKEECRKKRQTEKNEVRQERKCKQTSMRRHRREVKKRLEQSAAEEAINLLMFRGGERMQVVVLYAEVL